MTIEPAERETPFATARQREPFPGNVLCLVEKACLMRRALTAHAVAGAGEPTPRSAEAPLPARVLDEAPEIDDRLFPDLPPMEAVLLIREQELRTYLVKRGQPPVTRAKGRERFHQARQLVSGPDGVAETHCDRQGGTVGDDALRAR
jgi:hypothetical protein